MPSPDGHRAPSRQKPLTDADAPGKHQRVKGKPFCSPGPGLGERVGFAGLPAVPAVVAVLAVVVVGCTPRCEALGGAAAHFHRRPD